MNSFIRKAVSFLKARYAPRGARQSFAGSGEDLIMADLLRKAGVKNNISYIDIGAYHPVFGNNTYYFYRTGGRGVLVEPNPKMCDKIRKKRKLDVCVNAGVGGEDREAEFYSFDRDTRNTFSEEEARAWERSSGQKAIISKARIISLDTIIVQYFADKPIHILSIDTEGYEIEILSKYTWEKRPKLICLEVISSSQEENNKIYEFMDKNGYRLAGKTDVNAIFEDKI